MIINLVDQSVDLSGDTITAAVLVEGYTAHDSSGNAIIGALSMSDLVHHRLKEEAYIGSYVGSHVTEN